MTDGCSRELRMFEEVEFRDTKEGSNPIRKPSHMPEITHATADLSGWLRNSAWNWSSCKGETLETGDNGVKETTATLDLTGTEAGTETGNETVIGTGTEQNNWRASCKKGVYRFFGRFSFFAGSSWFLADWLVLTLKASFRNFFCRLALRSPEITCAKKLSFPLETFCSTKNKRNLLFR